MAFQIKDFVSISASMVNWMKSAQKIVTDFSIGSIARTMLEAIAIEMEELYYQMFIGLKEAIPVSVYNSFRFGLLDPVPASGNVQVTITSAATDTLISAGSSLSLPNGKVFKSTLDVTITAGNTAADVPVACTVPGLDSNIPAGQSFILTPAPSNFISAVNSADFTNGADAETEEARKLRFNAFIQALPRGTNAAIEYALENLVFLTDSGGNVTERVATSSIVEPWISDNTQPVSLVNCYIHNGTGSTSGALVTQASKIIYGYTDTSGNKVPGWKAAGVNVTMAAASEVVLNITGTLTAAENYSHADLVTAANQVITSYLLSLAIGESAVKAEIVRRVKEIEGVYNIVFSGLSDVTTATSSQKIMPGTLTIG